MNFKTVITICLMILLSNIAISQTTNSSNVMVRIKDVARLSGNEEYTITGYGIVIGLNGTGDSDLALTQRTMSNLLQRFNIIVNEADIVTDNVAAVMITGKIKGSAHDGDQIPVSVETIGDAESITGGTLLLSPLLGADGEVWAIAQGPVTTGGFSYGNDSPGGEKVVKNHPTSGLLTNGAKLLRDVGINNETKDEITYFLRIPDYTSAINFTNAVNAKFFGAAIAKDAATIKIRIPKSYNGVGGISKFISEVEQITFENDQKARIVFNEKTGTLVIGSNVKLSAAAVSHANLVVNIKNTQTQAPNNPFTNRSNAVLNDQQTTVQEGKPRVFEVPATTTIGDLVELLNSLGVSTRDIMIIFQLLRQAGALHAEIEAM
jgi:flagellar P-ring protein precursor FlgI